MLETKNKHFYSSDSVCTSRITNAFKHINAKRNALSLSHSSRIVSLTSQKSQGKRIGGGVGASTTVWDERWLRNVSAYDEAEAR